MLIAILQAVKFVIPFVDGSNKPVSLLQRPPVRGRFRAGEDLMQVGTGLNFYFWYL